MMKGLPLMLCTVLLTGCAGTPAPAIAPSQVPAPPAPATTVPTPSAPLLSEEDLERAVDTRPRETILLNPTLDITPFVDRYLEGMKASRITSVQTKLTTLAEVNDELDYPGGGGRYTEASAVYLVTIRGELFWPGEGHTSIDLLTGETVVSGTRGNTLYVVFSAQNGHEFRMMMPHLVPRTPPPVREALR